MERLKKFLKGEEGLEMVEYALMGALFAILLIAGVTAMKDAVLATFNTIAAAIP